MKHYTKLNEDQNAELLEMHAAGKTAGEIATHFGIHYNTVGHALWKAGLTKKKPGRRRFFSAEQIKLMSSMYEAGSTHQQIGEKLHVHAITVARYLKEAGVTMRPAGFQVGEAHSRWNGGKTSHTGGYVLVRIYHDDPYFCMAKEKVAGARYVLEHRLVMARHLGRPLTEDETVHHIDDTDRSNNDISNLQLRRGRHGKAAALQCRACGSCDIVAVALKEPH